MSLTERDLLKISELMNVETLKKVVKEHSAQLQKLA